MNMLEVVVGAQFGSEAKGHVVQRLTERAQDSSGVPQVLRVAGPNAGHTGYDARGRRWALRQVPVAAVTEGPAVLGITAGSEIDLPVLLEEFDQLREAGLLANKMLWVHGEATVINRYDKAIEAGFRTASDFHEDEFDLVKQIGSTGKGIGAARASRLMREPGRRVSDNEEAMSELQIRNIPIADADHRADASYDHTIIEGTQGFGLGLHAGYYPQCTSSDCRAQDFIAMAGISPWKYRNGLKIWAVARMYPIRVAGNSGPLRNETTWADLGLPEEHTTVTKKVRRVGYPDWELVRKAVRANGGSPTVRVALTMVDQMFPALRDKNLMADGIDKQQLSDYGVYAKDVERQIQAKIGMVTTGPNTATYLDF